MKSSCLFGGFIACLAIVGFGPSDADARRLFNKGVEKAAAEIAGCTDSAIQGRATLKERFTEEGIKEVEVWMFVKGLSDGKHAVHIHGGAACTPTCSTTKGDHDPGAIDLYTGNPNAPDSPHFNHPFHMGDLVNIEVRNGIGVIHTTTNRISLSEGHLSIFGVRETMRAVPSSSTPTLPSVVTCWTRMNWLGAVRVAHGMPAASSNRSLALIGMFANKGPVFTGIPLHTSSWIACPGQIFFVCRMDQG